jgi:hypothetical protein
MAGAGIQKASGASHAAGMGDASGRGDASRRGAESGRGAESAARSGRGPASGVGGAASSIGGTSGDMSLTSRGSGVPASAGFAASERADASLGRDASAMGTASRMAKASGECASRPPPVATAASAVSCGPVSSLCSRRGGVSTASETESGGRASVTAPDGVRSWVQPTRTMAATRRPRRDCSSRRIDKLLREIPEADKTFATPARGLTLPLRPQSRPGELCRPGRPARTPLGHGR